LPSPLGHALAGIATGFFLSRMEPPGPRPRWFESPGGLVVLFAAAACVPDLDLLVGAHNGATHSLGAAALAGLVAFMLTGRTRLALVVAVVYGSHVVLDWFNRDTSPPLGVMALWPFSRDHFIAPWPVLPPISRRYWLPGFWTHTALVAVFELVVFGGLAGIAAWRHLSKERSPRRNGDNGGSLI
jgi:membrane-bound metal-dependent hydrolase YbcI (DUF457 family)